MSEEHILDSIVREAIEKAELGEFSRRTAWEREEDDSHIHLRIPSGRAEGRIIYSSGKTLTIGGYCHTVLGIRKRSDPHHMITQEAVERYKTAERKQREKEDKKYEGESAAWKKRKSRSLHPPFPTHRVGVEGAEYGILLDSPKDKGWITARLERVVIQYVHPDAIMNIERLNKTTDVTGEALLQAMEKVRARYNVERGYLSGIELHDWHYPEGMIGATPTNCGPKQKDQQDNVFQRKFQGKATADEITEAIKNVYAAGEAFRTGIYRLREEKAARIAEETRTREEATRAMVEKF